MFHRIEDIGSLAEMDGQRLAVQYQRAVRALIHDCENRPGDRAARKLTIELSITPSMVEGGYLQDVNVEATVKSKVPAHVTRPINYAVKSNHGAAFNDMSEGDVDQRTIDE